MSLQQCSILTRHTFGHRDPDIFSSEVYNRHRRNEELQPCQPLDNLDLEKQKGHTAVPAANASTNLPSRAASSTSNMV